MQIQCRNGVSESKGCKVLLASAHQGMSGAVPLTRAPCCTCVEYCHALAANNIGTNTVLSTRLALMVDRVMMHGMSLLLAAAGQVLPFML